MMSCLRYDSGTLSGPEMTQEGYLRCWATIARTGVQTYIRGDGSKVVEYRSPEEVGNVDALASFAGKVVTLEHPSEGPLTSENTAKYAVGFTDSEVVFDGKYVRVRMTITDSNAIKSVLDGKTTECSGGYRSAVIDSAGVDPEGNRYDAVQTMIRGNHVAITEKARAGRVTRLHLDSADAVAETAEHVSPTASTPMAKIKIRDAEYEVSEAVALAYTTAQREDQAKLDSLKSDKEAAIAERDAVQAKFDSLQGESDELKTRVDSLKSELDQEKSTRLDSDAINKLVDQRIALIQSAQLHLDSDFDYSGKSEREIREAVIVKIHGDSVDLKEKSDAYIEARFDSILEFTNPNEDLRQAIGTAFNKDSADSNSDSGRASYVKSLETAWQQPSTKGAN